MDYYAGLDVSMNETHICVVERGGGVVLEAKTSSTPEAIAAVLETTPACQRIVLETGRMAPMVGQRGLGGERAVRWGTAVERYVAASNEETLVIPVVETAEASANIGEILDVPGLEAISFGPSDLSQSLGHMAVWEGPGVAEDILRMAHLAQERGIVSGIIGTNAEDIARRHEQGFQMIGLGSDAGLLVRQLRQSLAPYLPPNTGNGWY